MKTNSKTLIAEVVIRSKHPKKLPDFGIGKGVLSREEIVYKDVKNRGFKSPLFAMALAEHEDKMIQDVVEVRWIEKKQKGRTK